MRKEIGSTASTLHTHTLSGKPDGVVLHFHPWDCAFGQPARQASALVCEGARATS